MSIRVQYDARDQKQTIFLEGDVSCSELLATELDQVPADARSRTFDLQGITDITMNRCDWSRFVEREKMITDDHIPMELSIIYYDDFTRGLTSMMATMLREVPKVVIKDGSSASISGE